MGVVGELETAGLVGRHQPPHGLCFPDQRGLVSGGGEPGLGLQQPQVGAMEVREEPRLPCPTPRQLHAPPQFPAVTAARHLALRRQVVTAANSWGKYGLS